MGARSHPLQSGSMEPHELIGQVQSREDLVRFVGAMLGDLV